MPTEEVLSGILAESRKLFLSENSWPMTSIQELCEKVCNNFLNGRKLAFVGNGGSAAEAMHLAAEFTGKCVIPHDPWPAIALNESQSSLTAIANDFGTDYIFARQVQALLKENDILIALSTSGRSPNILKALNSALKLGVSCYLWTGASAPQIDGVDTWSVPSISTPRIQEVHLVWGHMIAESVEKKLTRLA